MKLIKIMFLSLFACTLAFSAVNINTASKTQLMTLEGIDSKKANAIIDYRKKTKFNYIEDIKKVDGIGTATFNKIKHDIIVENKTLSDSFNNNAIKNTKDSTTSKTNSAVNTAKKSPEEIAQDQAKKKATNKAKDTTIGKAVTKVDNTVSNVKEEVLVKPSDRIKG